MVLVLLTRVSGPIHSERMYATVAVKANPHVYFQYSLNMHHAQQHWHEDLPITLNEFIMLGKGATEEAAILFQISLTFPCQ